MVFVWRICGSRPAQDSFEDRSDGGTAIAGGQLSNGGAGGNGGGSAGAGGAGGRTSGLDRGWPERAVLRSTESGEHGGGREAVAGRAAACGGVGANRQAKRE